MIAATPPARPVFRGHRLRAARIGRGLTQRQVAERIGTIGRVTVTHWETGRRTPDAQDVGALVNALNCEFDDLYEVMGT